MMYSNFPTLSFSSPLDERSPFSSLLPIIFGNDLFGRRQESTKKEFFAGEDTEHIYFEADVPGMEPEEIEVTVDKGILIVQAACKESTTSREKTQYSRRSQSASFKALIPSKVDLRKEPHAHYKNGVLRIVFHKTKCAAPQKIAVRES